MVGTPKKRVASCRAAASSTPSTVKAGRSTADAPASRVPCSPLHRPWAWKRGRARTRRSSAVHRQASSSARLLARRLPWVRAAPFGAPVVPDV
jgi:hypothetical protein